MRKKNLSVTDILSGNHLPWASMDVAELEAAQAVCRKASGTMLENSGANGKPLSESDNILVDSLIAKHDDIAAVIRARFEGAHPTRPAGRGKKFAEMFGSSAISAAGWSNADEFLSAIHQQVADPRLQFAPAAGLVAVGRTTSPADGGYAVPTQFVAEWLDASLEDEIVRSRARVFPMTSGTLQVPGFDSTTHTSSIYGFAGGWVGEAAEITPETAKLKLFQMVAKKLGVLAEVSNELLNDGMGYAEQLSQAIIKAMGFHLDDGFLNGDGASGPLGVLKSSALISVAKETNQPANTIRYENLVNMFARLNPPSVKTSVWVAHQSTIPMLTTMGIVIGVGGSHIPVMTESDGTFKILTRPVLFTEKVPALGSKGDIGLYDFSQYGSASARTWCSIGASMSASRGTPRTTGASYEVTGGRCGPARSRRRPARRSLRS